MTDLEQIIMREISSMPKKRQEDVLKYRAFC